MKNKFMRSVTAMVVAVTMLISSQGVVTSFADGGDHSDMSESSSVQMNEVGNNGTDQSTEDDDAQCICGVTDGEAHKEGCPLYVKPDGGNTEDDAAQCTCGAAEGAEHLEGCPLYQQPEDPQTPSCTCGAAEGAEHLEDCPLYQKQSNDTIPQPQNDSTFIITKYGDSTTYTEDFSFSLQQNAFTMLYPRLKTGNNQPVVEAEWDFLQGENLVNVSNIFNSTGKKITGLAPGTVVLKITYPETQESITCTITIEKTKYTVSLKFYKDTNSAPGVTEDSIEQALKDKNLLEKTIEVTAAEYHQYYIDFSSGNNNKDLRQFVHTVNGPFGEDLLSVGYVGTFYYNPYQNNGTFVAYLRENPGTILQEDTTQPVTVTLINRNNDGKAEKLTTSYYVYSSIAPMSDKDFLSDNPDDPVTSWMVVKKDTNGNPIKDSEGNYEFASQYHVTGSYLLTEDVYLYANHNIQKYWIRLVELPAGSNTEVIRDENIDEIDDATTLYTPQPIPGSIYDETLKNVSKTFYESLSFFGYPETPPYTTPLLNYLKQEGLAESNKIFGSIAMTQYDKCTITDEDDTLFTVMTYIYTLVDPPVNPPVDKDPDPNPRPSTGGDEDDDTPTIINETPVPTTTIEDEDVPMADLPEDTVTIDDEEVPLKDIPNTGDMIPVPAMVAAVISIGGIALLMKKHK